ncbi:MAG: four helix bundle protein [Gemmatimonadota bacterium]
MGLRRFALLIAPMSFEKMRVYLAAEKLAQKVHALIPTIPEARKDDGRHLGEAASSVPYNIAEAYGLGRSNPRLSQGKKLNHLEIARGSVDEVRAILRRLTQDGILPEKVTTPLMILARTIAKMLTGLINKIREG